MIYNEEKERRMLEKRKKREAKFTGVEGAKSSEESTDKNRLKKEKRKIVQKITVQEVMLIEEELKEMKTVENTQNRVRHEYKNLMS